jgi:hypothetical protein
MRCERPCFGDWTRRRGQHSIRIKEQRSPADNDSKDETSGVPNSLYVPTSDVRALDS